MRRRSLLRTAVGIGVAATAGCLGYTVQSEADVAARKTEIANKQATIDEQQSEMADLEARVETLNATIEDRERRIAELESTQADNEDAIARLEGEVARLRKQKVSELYAIGYTSFTEGLADLRDGDEERRAGEFDVAHGAYLRADGRFKSASTAFGRAKDLLFELSDPPTVGATIGESIRTTDSYAGAAINYGIYCVLMGDGKDSDAETYQAAAEAARSDAESGTVLPADQFDAELGL